VDVGKLDYYSYDEIRKNDGKLRKEGYNIDILLKGGERSEYLHMEIC
jgi:hypothetical protein